MGDVAIGADRANGGICESSSFLSLVDATSLWGVGVGDAATCVLLTNRIACLDVASYVPLIAFPMPL